MATTADVRTTPMHLWLVAVFALLWNAFGCYDFWMTETANQAYLSHYPADAMAYVNSLPGWLTAMWALGVWGGLAGSLLLLARHRFAVWLFGLSAIGAIVGIGYEMLMTQQPASMKSGAMAVMPFVAIVLALFFLWYAFSEEQKGIIR
jgi:hypothetical protein